MTTIRIDRGSICDRSTWTERRVEHRDGTAFATTTIGRMRADGRFVPTRVLGEVATFNAWVPVPPSVAYECAGFDVGVSFFEYESAEVECVGCGERFPPSKLDIGVRTELDEEVVCRRVCPICGHWDCCEIAWEDASEAQLQAWYREYREGKR